jgi:PAS domain S-box-containing protein
MDEMKEIKILMVEDNYDDAELIKYEIKKGGITFKNICVDKRDSYIFTLQNLNPDIILSDYSLPQFNGLDALKIKEELAPLTPFILITGSLNEETAVEIMKSGADDYILKDHLTRLCTSIIASIEKKELVKSKIKAEEKIRLLANALKSISECVSITDTNDVLLYVNESFLNTYGYSEDELIGKNIQILRPDYFQPDSLKEILPQTVKGGWKGELVNKRKDGSLFAVYLSTSAVKDENDNTIALIGVAMDITEIKKSREELILAKERAEKSDKLKSEFLAQISHEIRSPLNITLNCANVIKEELENTISPVIKNYLDGIETTGKRLIRTIDLIINMSEMQIGDYAPVWTDFDLFNDVIEKLSFEYTQSAENKNLHLSIINNTSDAVLHVDRYSVNQIIDNILDNAVKFTEEGIIKVTIDKNEKNNLVVIVEDTGIGISEEFMEHIFEPFMQEDRGYTRKYEGNGLGLALAKKYCDLNNASINVESKKGKGSKFIVTFNTADRM